MIDKYQALTPTKYAMEIVKNCFQSERDGDRKARVKAQADLKKVMIKTEDGSYTLPSSGENSETMHTHHGAVTESLEKFVKPAQLEGKKEVRILDVCSGLGYNTASFIEHVDGDAKIEVDMIEISRETTAAILLIDNPLKSYEILKRNVEEKLFNEGYLCFKSHNQETLKRISINIYIDDARKVVEELKGEYDAVFLDPFSPSKSPELYTPEFFHKLKDLLNDDGIILTYTSAAPVRSGMVQSGLHVGEGPVFGRKTGGTVASRNPQLIEKSLSAGDERIIALSDVGIPYKDPDLNNSSPDIINRRDKEREWARGNEKFASTVKTPLYLYQDMEDTRLKRRVLKNIEKLGIDDLKSEKAAYLVCPQFEECICFCGKAKKDSSRDRIDEMKKRLKITLKD